MNPRRYQLILAYLTDERRQPVVMATTAVIIFVIGGFFLMVLPAFQDYRENKYRFIQLQLEADRQAPPKPDQNLEERLFAFDEILRKQEHTDYEIPPSRLALIRKHWAELILDMTPEDAVMLREQLKLDAPPPEEPFEPVPKEPEPKEPVPKEPEPIEFDLSMPELIVPKSSEFDSFELDSTELDLSMPELIAPKLIEE